MLHVLDIEARLHVYNESQETWHSTWLHPCFGAGVGNFVPTECGQ